jgi:hypothetical protein
VTLTITITSQIDRDDGDMWDAVASCEGGHRGYGRNLADELVGLEGDAERATRERREREGVLP